MIKMNEILMEQVQWNTILSNVKENIRCENWTWLYTRRLDSFFSWRQQHDEIRVLPRFKKRIVDIRAIQGPTGGVTLKTDINRSCDDSIQLKSIYLPQVLRVVKVLSHEQVSRQEESKVKKEDHLFSSRYLIHSEVMHMKERSQVMIFRNPEKFLRKVIGEVTKTLWSG